jgi:1,4-dihydroxy-2-naphthoyl-CoA hydrolase
MWKKKVDLESLNKMATRGLGQCLGIRLIKLTEDSLWARMPVSECTKQPFGLLHGGASAALAETLGSIGAWLLLDDNAQAVGLELNINHIRGKRQGEVTACAKPLHAGRSTQVWDIRIQDEDARLVAVARLTVSVIQSREGAEVRGESTP